MAWEVNKGIIVLFLHESIDAVNCRKKFSYEHRDQPLHVWEFNLLNAQSLCSPYVASVLCVLASHQNHPEGPDLGEQDDSPSNNLASNLDPQELNSRGEVSSKRSPHRQSMQRASFRELSELLRQCPEIQSNVKGCQWAKWVSQIHPHCERARECLKVSMTAWAAPSQTPGSPIAWNLKLAREEAYISPVSRYCSQREPHRVPSFGRSLPFVSIAGSTVRELPGMNRRTGSVRVHTSHPIHSHFKRLQLMLNF